MKIVKIISVVFATLMMVTPSFANENTTQNDVVKIVYQCDFADVKRVHLMLNTLNNVVKYYDKSLIQYDLKVVALGPCLQYMMKDFEKTGFASMPYHKHGGPTGSGTDSRFSSLKQLGGDNVEFFACKNTMKKKHVKPEQIDDAVTLTTAGIIKIIDLQHEGYSYIKIK
ncbi:hypothetical protein MNB_SM-4-241 [hydrothermal vent metagenome]|uniref:Uncharacterized protein n=1 Tax=hydrothermal vent metagenome TaxID=652676 RepID=A0A1W1C5H0_9ZZZZ